MIINGYIQILYMQKQTELLIQILKIISDTTTLLWDERLGMKCLYFFLLG